MLVKTHLQILGRLWVTIAPLWWQEIPNLSLAIFDLDNTLLTGDSDYLWGCFLVEQGLVDATSYEQINRQFYEDYKAGTLDITAFLTFSLRPLAKNDMATLHALQQKFMGTHIEPAIAPCAHELLAKHRAQGDFLLMITATNRFITYPIAQMFEMDDLLATDAEIINDRYTGQVAGIPCFQEGKVKRLESWLQNNHCSLENSYFYTDSHNDIPLLEQVTHAIAVDPDAKLARYAEKMGWPVMSLRNQPLT